MVLKMYNLKVIPKFTAMNKVFYYKLYLYAELQYFEYVARIYCFSMGSYDKQFAKY